MNSRNDYVTSTGEASEYIEKMIKNARKHGILIYSMTGMVPMANRSFGKIVTDNLRDMTDIKVMTEEIHRQDQAIITTLVDTAKDISEQIKDSKKNDGNKGKKA